MIWFFRVHESKNITDATGGRGRERGIKFRNGLADRFLVLNVVSIVVSISKQVDKYREVEN